jgi:hypothetical protein
VTAGSTCPETPLQFRAAVYLLLLNRCSLGASIMHERNPTVPYETRLDIHFKPLEIIDERAISLLLGLFPPCAAHPDPAVTTMRSGDQRRRTRSHTPASE